MDTLLNGDIVMVRDLTGAFLPRQIMRVTGAVHHHDEMVLRVGGNPYTCYHHPPHADLWPFENRMSDHRNGKCVFAVFRLNPVRVADRLPSIIPFMEVYRANIGAVLCAFTQLEVPYDTRAIFAIYRDWLLDKLSLGIIQGSEQKLYCTEGCFVASSCCGIDLQTLLHKPQPYPAPIHMEELYHSGFLDIVADFGLKRYL